MSQSCTRFLPSTMTFGILSSRMTLVTIPVCPLSFPAVITTLSPRSIFHFSLGNMALIAFLLTPIAWADGKLVPLQTTRRCK